MSKGSHRDNNIFYRVIWNETNFTDIFCNFLSYDIFRKLFIEFIDKEVYGNKGELEILKISYDNFDTEIDLKENGRADLFLKLDSGEEYIFEIKNKAYTSTTENQPTGYEQYLENNGFRKENLIFIIPKHYIHQKDITGCNIVYWEDILKVIEKNGLDILNPFIGEFCKFCKMLFGMHIIVFTSLEQKIIDNQNTKEKKVLKMAYDTNLPKIMRKINQLTDDIASLTGLDGKRKQDAEAEWYGYSKSVTDDKGNEYTLWVGVDYEIWEKYNIPISLQLITIDEQSEPRFEGIETDEIQSKNTDGKLYIVKLNKKIYDKDFKEHTIDLIKKIK